MNVDGKTYQEIISYISEYESETGKLPDLYTNNTRLIDVKLFGRLVKQIT